MNILQNREDSEEAVNDAYLAAWSSIPPESPAPLSTYIGRLVRNISLNKYEARNAKKRGGRPEDGSATLMLSELEECIPSARNVEEEVDGNELARTIDEFLATVKQEDRFYFVRRYWHYCSVPEIARQFSVGESKVKVSLHRTRKKLKAYLEERGIQT
jgi:RNA polymerase sigma-70 factor (ECF subfamily)